MLYQRDYKGYIFNVNLIVWCKKTESVGGEKDEIIVTRDYIIELDGFDEWNGIFKIDDQRENKVEFEGIVVSIFNEMIIEFEDEIVNLARKNRVVNYL